MGGVLLLGAVVALAALAACAPPEPAHDIAYYRDHPADRAAKMSACRNDRRKFALASNCVNALAADSEAVSKTFWAAPEPASRVAAPGKL